MLSKSSSPELHYQPLIFSTRGLYLAVLSLPDNSWVLTFTGEKKMGVGNWNDLSVLGLYTVHLRTL